MPEPRGKKITGRLPDLPEPLPEDTIPFGDPKSSDILWVVAHNGRVYIGSWPFDRVAVAQLWNALGRWLNTGKLR
jgi:hypothetical protein